MVAQYNREEWEDEREAKDGLRPHSQGEASPGQTKPAGCQVHYLSLRHFELLPLLRLYLLLCLFCLATIGS